MPNAVIIFVVLLVFVGTLVIGGLAWGSFRSRREARDRALARRIGSLDDNSDDALFRLSVRDPIAESLGRLGKELESLLIQADADYMLQGLLIRVAMYSMTGVLFLGLLTRHGGALGGALFGLVPILILRGQAAKRARRLSEQLPEALDLVGRSLQAGHGLSDAMRLCAEEMPLPVASEFGHVFEEHNLGRDLRDALNSLSLRNPKNFDLKIFVSSVLLQRDTGGNLIEILENISRTIRDRFVFKAKVKALTAEARFSAMILGGLPFALLGILLFMRPEYLVPLIADPIGHVLVLIAVSCFVLGTIVMMRISSIDV
jgi:tight adherence protein B